VVQFHAKAKDISLLQNIQTMESTQPAIQWILAALSPGAKCLGHKADHPPSSSAEVKNVWSCKSSPSYTLYHAEGQPLATGFYVYYNAFQIRMTLVRLSL